ncbi:MAG: hemolysin family protein [Treponema sp.]|nr:hemolysin family protein [Treponema sp.]
MEPFFSITISLILTFLLLNAVFSLFYFSLNLCRKSRLEKEQKKRYRAVLKILENPDKLKLSCRLWGNIFKVFTIFVITFISIIFVPAFFYNAKPLILITIHIIVLIILGIIITLICDALPKLLARLRPEKTAAFLLPVMKIFSIPMLPFTMPALKLASFFNSSFKAEIDDSITEDELRDALIEGEKSGIVESKERTMVEGVFYLGDRPVGAFMTHRSEIQWIDINESYEEIRNKAVEHRVQKCFPVINANQDEIVGAVYLEDIILDYSQPNPQGIRSIMKKALFVPETMSALKAFESFKQGQSDFLFVMDEYGGMSGIISITALVEEIVGELSTPAASEEPLVKQEDGTWLADGSLNIDDAAKALFLPGLGEEGDFHTLAGFILHLAGELPRTGDNIDYQNYRFKVKKMEGNRIDKLLITKID